MREGEEGYYEIVASDHEHEHFRSQYSSFFSFVFSFLFSSFLFSFSSLVRLFTFLLSLFPLFSLCTPNPPTPNHILPSSPPHPPISPAPHSPLSCFLTFPPPAFSSFKSPAHTPHLFLLSFSFFHPFITLAQTNTLVIPLSSSTPHANEFFVIETNRTWEEEVK